MNPARLSCGLQNKVKRTGLLFVIGFRFRLRLGATLGFRGERTEQLFLGDGAAGGIFALVGLRAGFFRLVHFGVFLQRADIVFLGLVRLD